MLGIHTQVRKLAQWALCPVSRLPSPIYIGMQCYALFFCWGRWVETGSHSIVLAGLELTVMIVLLCVLVTVTIAVLKHHDQKQVGKERVYLIYTSTPQFIIKGIQDSNQTGKGPAVLQTCLQPDLMEAFSQLRFSPLDDSSLYQYKTSPYTLFVFNA